MLALSAIVLRGRGSRCNGRDAKTWLMRNRIFERDVARPDTYVVNTCILYEEMARIAIHSIPHKQQTSCKGFITLLAHILHWNGSERLKAPTSPAATAVLTAASAALRSMTGMMTACHSGRCLDTYRPRLLECLACDSFQVVGSGTVGIVGIGDIVGIGRRCPAGDLCPLVCHGNVFTRRSELGGSQPFRHCE